MKHSRLKWFHLGYFIATLAYITLFVVISHSGEWKLWAVCLALVCILLPGRIQGVLLRDLFRGRVQLSRKRPRDALDSFNAMLDRLAKNPRLEWSIWLTWPMYTRSIQAMTLNDIGVAHDALENDTAALEAWQSALTIDPTYPIPYLNLAARELRANRLQSATAFLEKAREAGYTGSLADRIVQRGQAALASIGGSSDLR
jgi:tetratricopeptide (TPR) repeat protein